MKVYFKNYCFAPKWYFIVSTICVSILFISLGCWQLSRADEKNQLQHMYTTRLKLPSLSLEQLPIGTDIRYYPLKISGYYDNAHTILLDNKIHAHQIGYEVLTPFMTNHHAAWVLVNRGWVPAALDRRILPIITAEEGPQTIIGNVYIIPDKIFTLGAPEINQQWPLRISYVNLLKLSLQLHHPLHNFILLLSPLQKAGFIRDWQPVAISAYTNLGYAVQWFTFAFVLIIIFIVLNIKRYKY